MRSFKEHPLIHSLLALKGNPRTLVLIEPLWGIPYNLIAPFATLYMYALGVTDAQIGLILSISTIFKVFFAFMGGIFADKYGRKRTTMFGDLLGWSLACLIWAFSQNFWWFLIATLMNCFEYINQTAWQCLTIEDADEKEIVNIYSWITIAGLLAVLFAPLSGLLIESHSLVTVVRWLYVAFSILMFAKFYITWRYTKETTQGLVRMEQTKQLSLWQMAKEYKQVLPLLFKRKSTLCVLILTVLLSISGMVTSTFFGLYVNISLGISETMLAIFPILRAVVMLVFFFGVARMLERFPIKQPLIIGLILYVVSHIILVFSPKGALWPLIIYTLLEAIANSLVYPRKESLMMMDVDKEERARLIALIVTFTFVFSIPFGYLAGLMSALDRRLPLVFAGLLYIASVITAFIYKPSAPTTTESEMIP